MSCDCPTCSCESEPTEEELAVQALHHHNMTTNAEYRADWNRKNPTAAFFNAVYSQLDYSKFLKPAPDFASLSRKKKSQ